MKNIAIITARGGSKRIPGKNIRDFLGKPVIAYSIEAAVNSGCFDEVMVSTDDKEIAAVSEKYGAKIPFFRSEKNSDDFATTSEVLTEVLGRYIESGFKFDNACCIYPAAPFIKTDTIKKAFKEFIDEDAYALMPVVRFGYPIQRAFKTDGHFLKLLQPENINKRSQDLEPAYHDAGQFYWLRIKEFLVNKSIITDKTAYYEIPELYAQDIDDESDWNIAELKYKIISQKNK
ncbi:MAG: pseudaminic acid cytidylyltransferase [Ignavibacteriae bacterium]|nr:pseudaminic acid cytidylyltransferase [Ignavibacteriota bacterium]